MGKNVLSRKLVFAALLILTLGQAAPGVGADTFPAPRGAVNDFAGVIPAPDVTRIEAVSREVLDKTGTAIVVATMQTIGDQDPNDYVNRLYQAWRIGKKGEDKGVLIFLAVKERRVRIETGYGVEGIIPDGLAGEILDRYTLPYFRDGNYGKGFSETVNAVAAVVAKAAGASLTGVPSPERRPAESSETGMGSGLLRLILLLAALFFLLGTPQGRAMLPWLLVMIMSGGGGRRGGGGDGFGGFGGGGFGGFGGGSSGGGGAGRGF